MKTKSINRSDVYLLAIACAALLLAVISQMLPMNLLSLFAYFTSITLFASVIGLKTIFLAQDAIQRSKV